MYNFPGSRSGAKRMWQHNYAPIGGSLGVSAVFAAIPIVVLFLMLGVLRKPSWMSALAALASAFVLSLLVYGMPAKLAILSTLYGAAYGLFPIAWVVFSSIMLYRLAVDTGKFEIIKDSVGSLTDDRRLQAIFIAFSFGAFIEGAAGFGAPVAVAGAMLAGLGFNPFYAAGICLLANTAPVAFGSIGIPVVTLANVTGLPLQALSSMVGRLCAMVSVFIPGYLIVVMAGRKRALEIFPAIAACGISFAGMQFFVSNYVGAELTDIVSSLTCILVMVAVLKLWKPKNIMRLDDDGPVTVAMKRHPAGEVFVAWLPYLLLVIFVLAWGAPSIKAVIDRWTNGLLPAWLPKNAGTLNGLNVPGLHNQITRVPPVTAAPAPYAAVFTFNWLSAAGTACLFATLTTALFLRVKPERVVKAYTSTFAQLKFAILTVAAMLGLAYLMNYSGMTSTLGLALASTGKRLSVLQRRRRMDGRLPDRQRHIGQRALRQPAGGDGERARLQPDPDGLGQFSRGRDGEDDLGAEHCRRRRGHRDDRGRREPAVPVHDQAQRDSDVRDGRAGAAVCVRPDRLRPGRTAEIAARRVIPRGRAPIAARTRTPVRHRPC